MIGVHKLCRSLSISERCVLLADFCELLTIINHVDHNLDEIVEIHRCIFVVFNFKIMCLPAAENTGLASLPVLFSLIIGAQSGPMFCLKLLHPGLSQIGGKIINDFGDYNDCSVA